MDRRSTSEEPESKGDEPFATNSTGEFVDIAEPLDFEEQLTNFDDGYALSDISPDMLKLLREKRRVYAESGREITGRFHRIYS